MNLDDRPHMEAVDREHMLGHIDALADQFENAWQHAESQPLPESHRSPRQIVLAGMGGSAIGGDLTAALLASTSPVPFTVVRGYTLPAYVQGADTLVIASSHSGDTEETLAAADLARERGARLLAITTGGALADHAERHGYPLWGFTYASQPRAALGWSFGLLIGLAHRLALAPSLEADLAEGVALLREKRPLYSADNPTVNNPAKRGAGQLMDRVPLIFGAGIFEPVARRWKGQFHENAKAWAEAEPLPEANHNLVAGLGWPMDHDLSISAQFITSAKYDHPRVRLRHELTYQMCLQNGIMADAFQPDGDSALAQMLHAIQYGDYVSYYSAIATDTDPTSIPQITELKMRLAERG